MIDSARIVGTIIKGVGGAYEIHLPSGDTVSASVRGIFRKEKITPTVGDHVILVTSGDPDIPYVIDRILERKNILIRPSIANMDVLLITVSGTEPSPDLKLLDKLLILCSVQGIEPIVVITKTDLSPDASDRICKVYSDAGFFVYQSDIRGISNVAELCSRLKDKTVAFAGQSGVGKSTLCNLLSGVSGMEVGEISERLRRGKHTTRHVELIPLKDMFLADTPGFSSLEVTRMQITPTDVLKGYPEIAETAKDCRFADCLHTGEMGCSVDLAGIDAGRLERYREFVRLLQSFRPYQGKGGDKRI